MKFDSFSEGIEVIYRHHVGFINFVCEQYITICVKRSAHSSGNVCLLVYPSQWREVHLYKESNK